MDFLLFAPKSSTRCINQLVVSDVLLGDAIRLPEMLVSISRACSSNICAPRSFRQIRRKGALKAQFYSVCKFTLIATNRGEGASVQSWATRWRQWQVIDLQRYRRSLELFRPVQSVGVTPGAGGVFTGFALHDLKELYSRGTQPVITHTHLALAIIETGLSWKHQNVLTKRWTTH